MAKGRGTSPPLMCLMLAVLLVVVSQGLVALSESPEVFGDRKNYYSPDPRVVSPPPHARRSRHSHRTTPSVNCPPPPRSTEPGCPPCGGHGTPSPSHGGGGGGGYYSSPPLVPNAPPSPTLTPITPTPPSPTITPIITPTSPATPCGPTTPLTPTISTPPPIITPTPPATPFGPTTPLTPTISTPPPIITPTPPATPFDPTTPLTPTIPTPPSPPFLPVDPNSPPFSPGIIPGTPIYWNMNPGFVWGIFGYFATISGLFGPATTRPFGRNLSVQEALSNTRADGIGELYRQGTAAFLNSMVDDKFPLSTQQVRRGFASALASERTAADQAKLFKLANEGRLRKKH